LIDGLIKLGHEYNAYWGLVGQEKRDNEEKKMAILNTDDLKLLRDHFFLYFSWFTTHNQMSYRATYPLQSNILPAQTFSRGGL